MNLFPKKHGDSQHKNQASHIAAPSYSWSPSQWKSVGFLSPDQLSHKTKMEVVPRCQSFHHMVGHRVSTFPTAWCHNSTHHWHSRTYHTWSTPEHTWTSNAIHICTNHHDYQQKLLKWIFYNHQPPIVKAEKHFAVTFLLLLMVLFICLITYRL